MIKINLIRNVSGPGAKGEIDQSVADGNVLSGTNSSMVINFILIGLMTALLLVYENYNIGQIEARLNTLRTQAEQISKQVEQKKAAYKQIETVSKESKALREKMVFLRNLSKTRLRELKALDFLQNLVPDRVWLGSIDYKNSKLVLKGFAFADSDLTDFIKNLDQNGYFKEVLLLQATETKTKTGTVKAYEITTLIKGMD